MNIATVTCLIDNVVFKHNQIVDNILKWSSLLVKNWHCVNLHNDLVRLTSHTQHGLYHKDHKGAEIYCICGYLNYFWLVRSCLVQREQSNNFQSSTLHLFYLSHL